MNDFRLALRSLRKSPSFAAAVILTLALAIGPISAIFSVVNAVLLRPLPFDSAEELVWISGARSREGRAGSTAASWLEYQRWRTRDDALSSVAAYFDRSFNLSEAGDPERVSGAVVATNLFETLGVKPVLGRTFVAAEAEPGRHRVVVLGNGLWRRKFGADEAVIGHEVALHGELHTVVGVMPEGFRFPQYAEVWVPLCFDVLGRAETEAFLWGLGRLPPGGDAEQAEVALEAAVRPLREVHPEELEEVAARVTPLREFYVGESGTASVLFLAATSLVLLVACANVAGLLLAKTSSRTAEIAVRTAMGAGRARMSRQLVAESVVLASIGGALGLVLGAWGLRLLELSIPVELPFWADFSLDFRVVAVVVLVSLTVGIALGLVPWLQVQRRELTAALREGGFLQGMGRRAGRLRNLLVMAEIALSIVLLASAALTGRSLLLLKQADLGFSSDGVLTFRIDLPARSFEDPASRRAFSDELARRLGAIPGVEAVGAVSALPLQSWFTTRYEPGGAAVGGDDEARTAYARLVAADYLRTLEIPLLRGRGFSEVDTADHADVVIVNETLAGRVWPGEDPLGRRLLLDGERPAEVVGVVADVRQSGTNPAVQPEILQPYSQRPSPSLYWLVRTAGAPQALAAPARRVMAELGSTIPIYQVKPMERVVEEALWQPRVYAWLLGVFAGIAVVLAAVGVYGVVAYLVEQRTREMGIRMALGARRSHAVAWVLRRAALTLGVGAVLGIAGAMAVARVLESLLYGVVSAGPLLYLSTALLLAIVAGVAVLLPARRAATVDPVTALRFE